MELLTGWLTHFCSDERARRWRSLVGNGGAAAAPLLLAVEAMERRKWTVNRSGRRAGEFMSWPAALGRPLRMAACSSDRRRAAHTHRAFSENGRYCSFDSVKTISLTAKIDSIGSLKP